MELLSSICAGLGSAALPEQLWWQLHRAGCGLLFTPLPGEGLWGSAPCAGVWAPPPQAAGGGQDVPGAPRCHSLTLADLFLRALAAAVLLSDPDARRRCPIRAVPSRGELGAGGRGRGGGTSVFHGVLGCRCDSFHEPSPSRGQSPKAPSTSAAPSAGSSVSQCVFAEHRQPMHMAGLFVYTHTCL